MIFAFICFFLYWLIEVLVSDDHILSAETLAKLLERVQIALALFIVCVPEGMPLAISVALALSTDNIHYDNLLIKNLKALETSGKLTEIVTSKTSTLTKGKLKVALVYTHNVLHEVRKRSIEP